MSPFDPPTGPPLSEAPLRHGNHRRRGRTAFVAVVAVGLLGAGAAGASQLLSAAGQGVAAATVEASSIAAAPESTVPETTAPDTTVVDDRSTDVTGRVELDVGDDDPTVIDLDEFDRGAVGALGECLGLLGFDLHLGDGPPGAGDLPDDLETWLDEWFSESGRPDWWPAEQDLDTFLDDVLSEWDVDPGMFGNGDLGTTFDDLFAEFGVTPDGQVTVTGPDGVSVIDIGDDGSVTITRDGGDITIETTGDATVVDLGDLMGDLGTLFGDELDADGAPDLGGDLERWIEEMLDGVPASGEVPEFGSVDPTEVQRCIEDALGR